MVVLVLAGQATDVRRFPVKHVLKRLFDPKVMISTLLSAALLAFALTFAGPGQVGNCLVQALAGAWLPALVLAVVYLAVKLVQWRVYLSRLGLKPSWPEVLVPYAGGEMGNSLPMGVYLENYLLKGSAGSGVGRSAAATTWMLITEIVICLVALLAFSVPAWSWVRPAAACILVGMLLVGFLFFRARFLRGWLDRWQPHRPWLQAIHQGVREFVEGSQALFSWRTFIYGLPLTAVYLGAQATTLYVVGNVIIAPTEPWNWMVATTAFAFSLVIVLLVPFLPHVGSVEVSGLGVLLTYGISRSHAVGSFLALRVLSTGAIMLVCGLILLLLHREVGTTFRRLSRRRKPATTSARDAVSPGQEEGVEERRIPSLEAYDQEAEAPSPR